MMSRVVPLKDIQSPTGSYNIGTDSFFWIDSTRGEWFTDDPNDNREILVQVWYPAIKNNNKTASWMDYPHERAESLSQNFGLPKFIAKAIDRIDTDTFIDTDPIDNGLFPVIIFSHGFEGFRTQNTTQIQELVSNGYIVFAVDHTYDSNLTIFPDGRKIERAQKYCWDCDQNNPEKFWSVFGPQIDTRASDIIFILDKIERLNNNFSGLMNLDKIGVFGHSFGGGTSVVASIKDSRIKSCISLDGWYTPVNPSIYETGLNVPFLHLGRISWEKKINYQILDSILVYGNSYSYKLSLEGSHHYDFTDSPHLSPLASTFKLSSDIDNKEILDVTNITVLGFFNKTLKLKSDEWLRKLEKNKRVVINYIIRDEKE